jgi:hypothetical protein
MLSKTTMVAFSDELTKLAFNVGEKALLGTGLAVGGIGGAIGKDYLQDAKEGRVMRREREFQQKQQLKAFKQGMNNG